MELYLLRHGIAEDSRQSPTGSDSSRRLTAEGRDKILGIAENLKNAGYEIDRVISSPLIRARQTAEIVAKVFKIKHEIILCDHLYPGSSAGDFLKELKSFRKDTEGLMAVGHEPFMSTFTEKVLGFQNGMIEFKKGGFCHLTLAWKGDSLQSVLHCLAPPKIQLGH